MSYSGFSKTKGSGVRLQSCCGVLTTLSDIHVRYWFNSAVPDTGLSVDHTLTQTHAWQTSLVFAPIVSQVDYKLKNRIYQ